MQTEHGHGFFVDYFTNLFSANAFINTEEVLKHVKPKVKDEINAETTKNVSGGELYQALKQMDQK